MRPRALQIRELLSTQSPAKAAHKDIYMEDIKLWELDGTQATPLGSNNQLESEHLLEETLVQTPKLLMEDLTLVGRQTPAGGGALDLLGVDGDGKLVVFELKREKLSRVAVAQIIDYASYLDDMGLEALADHISERSGVHGIDKIEDFQEWYDNQGFGDLESLKPLRMFLVGLGADDTTERMVKFLAQNSGMDISLLTFHAFDYHGKTILAKQVEVDAATEPDRRPTRRRRTQTELDRDFDEQMSNYGVRDLIDAVRGMFKEHWPESTERVGAHGLTIQLPEAYRMQYARIDAWGEGTLGLVFFPHTKSLCIDEFRGPVEKIPYQTYPENRVPLDDPETEIQFRLTAQEWSNHQERLTALVRAIYEAWQNKKQEGADSA